MTAARLSLLCFVAAAIAFAMAIAEGSGCAATTVPPDDARAAVHALFTALGVITVAVVLLFTRKDR